MPIRCPSCDREATEVRIKYRALSEPRHPRGGWWRTFCGHCRKHLGYRPVTSKEKSSGE